MGDALIVKGGSLVASTSVVRADLLIEGEKIAAIGRDIDKRGARIINAEHKFVMPGVVDAHVQLEISYRDTAMTDNFETGSKAAAAGGVTTIIDFADQKRGVTPLDTLRQRRQEAERDISVDYSLHLGLTDINEENLEQIPEIVEQGVPSFKIYMTYSNRGRMVSGGKLLDVMKRVKLAHGIVEVHAEDDPVIVYQTEKLLNSGKTEPKYFPESRLPLAEKIAINNALFMCEDTGCPLYVHHLTTADGLELIKAARSRGLEVYAETCPPYLLFTEEVYEREDAYLYIVNPPIRAEQDRMHLWQGVEDGSIDVIGTDHCSYLKSHKEKNRYNFDLIPAGFPGVETLLPFIYTTGVMSGRIDLPRLVELLCTNPARIFGLYPEKGSLDINTDADLVIYDPNVQGSLPASELKTNVDFQPFEDMIFSGKVSCTILRGMVVYEEGRILNSSRGKFLYAKL